VADLRAIAKETAASYQRMMQEYAWRKLDGFLSELIEKSNSELDVMAVEHLSATVAAHGRGVRDAVKAIRTHVDYALNPAQS
jgi:hypothetical protein